MKKIQTLLFLVCLVGIPGLSQEIINITEYGALFDTVQKAGIFADQKKFVDLTPKFHQSPGEILNSYLEAKTADHFNLRDFVAAHFDTVFMDTSDVIAHINYLWDYLTRGPDREQGPSTLLPLPYPYMVPGGRFREIYYWDSYFTMLGLAVAGKTEGIRNMIDNFAYLVDTYGHIPNGNRSYYLSRSQPPFFSLMIELYAGLPETDREGVYKEYRNVLKKEYDFWMNHAAGLSPGNRAQSRVVLLEDASVLNRYWDDRSTPRPESYVYDIETRENANRGEEIYRDIRAAAESGWDFSSRWFRDGKTLGSIQTTHMIPVDLNCLLYHMESMLGKMYDDERSAFYNTAARKRKEKILEMCWSEDQTFFFDYDFSRDQRSGTYSLAALYPLFFHMADTAQARGVANVIRARFLKEGGVVTTLYDTGQQWDYPNGWPPLQWIAYKALKNYGYDGLAEELAGRWIGLNVSVYFRTNKMLEKYDVVDIHRKGGGGEYDLQDGFGWTNGVFLALWKELHPGFVGK